MSYIIYIYIYIVYVIIYITYIYKLLIMKLFMGPETSIKSLS